VCTSAGEVTAVDSYHPAYMSDSRSHADLIADIPITDRSTDMLILIF
jgi:hypothetical protein